MRSAEYAQIVAVGKRKAKTVFYQQQVGRETLPQSKSNFQINNKAHHYF